ncbi:patatin-like phospholipase family protein [Vibrio methylphosphonaticus]|uniref:patatin-like phospholipase family protein n=1 Tax=Vibrio methylphosphonaticus TaxID=2946866 RepID=UPI00202ABF2F|nr:patatin-like phospholipase family protein [Vibrio methylphosphonaticus]MCL9773414.1 patatin-like phospholipase family protein [Vibrio methylphosphonaticus]
MNVKRLTGWLIASVFTWGSAALCAKEGEPALPTKQSTQENTLKSDNTRPKIGLVLAGGGAKGAAHIGVLKALEEMNIPVDIVTGTSMGAYVGGLYATGMSADEIESFIHTVDWNNGYVDRVNRSQRRIRDKEAEDRYQIRTDIGLHFGSIEAPKGVVQGQNMLRILRKTTGNLPKFQSFDDLAIPYRSVATDILKLEPVVIDQGYLVDAMMASMSVPGALPPYELGDLLLVDGGVTNNMPVELAKEMGADLIIAVDISSDYKTRDDFSSFLSVGEQLSNYLVRRSTEEQMQSLGDNDVYLHPDVGKIATTDFSSMPRAYELGYEAAYQIADQLQHLSVSSSDFQTYIDHKQNARRHLRYGDETVVDKVVINNQTHYSDSLLSNNLSLKSGQVLETDDIEEKIENLYALDRFELITYEYQEQGEDTALVVDVKEKSWGPNYMDFRFFLEEDFNANSFYAIGISTNFTDLNDRGAELRVNADFGTDKRIEAELYSPFLTNQDFFLLAGVKYSNERRNVLCTPNATGTGCVDPALEGNADFVPVTYRKWLGELSVGYAPTLWQEFKVGGRFVRGESYVSPLPSSGAFDFDRQGVFVNYKLDTLDDFSLPTKGWYINLEYLLSKDSGEQNINQTPSDFSDTAYEITAETKYAHTFGRNTFVGSFDYAVIETENATLPVNPRELGGFLNLSGIPRNSLIGENKLYGSLVYRYRWFDNDFGMFKSPVYLGASAEYGGVWDGDQGISGAPLFMAGSIFAGIDSPVGPIMLSYGRVETGLNSVYLIIGAAY